jgi:hypothetical protein
MASPRGAKENDMTLTVGVLALLEAKPGRQAEVKAFLESGRSA